MSMTLIQTITVGSGGVATITISSIPQTYTDLLILVAAQTNASAEYVDYLNVTFNGSTSGYNGIDLNGRGNGVSQNNWTSRSDMPTWGSNATGATANTFSNAQIYIPNYTGSTAKWFTADTVTENNGTNARQAITSAKWSGTSAITQISFNRTFGTVFNQNTVVSIYGILKGSGGANVS